MSLNPINSKDLTNLDSYYEDDYDLEGSAQLENNALNMNRYGAQASGKKAATVAPKGVHGMNTYAAHIDDSNKKKMSPLAIIAIVAAVLLVVVGGILGFNYFNNLASQERVFEGEATITIPSGYGTENIADILYEANIIADKSAFFKAVRSEGAEGIMKAGTYTFKRGEDVTKIVRDLANGKVDPGTTFTLPEGLTVEQTAERIANAFEGITYESFMDKAKASNYAGLYPFLLGAYNDSLEGFLFPKTYTLAKNATADDVIRVLLDQFVLETASIDWTQATQLDVSLTPYEAVVMASLIERETSIADERPLVASVMYNRMNYNPQMLLQIDATVAYALHKTGLITLEDLRVDSPYNTYMYEGLCPGPICSPSIESIMAAVYPADTDYIFYVRSEDLESRTHVFCETEEEFANAKAAYNAAAGIA